MKPSIKFLEKVEAGKVQSFFKYSQRKGGQYGFRGGAASYRKHLDGGYVTPVPVADLGRPGIVELTEKGREALENARAKS